MPDYTDLDLDCARCDTAMRWLPKHGFRLEGRYECPDCGFRFWVTAAHKGSLILPEFASPRERAGRSRGGHPVPPPPPRILELRDITMRRWLAAIEKTNECIGSLLARETELSETEPPRLGIISEHRTRTSGKRDPWGSRWGQWQSIT